MKNLITKPIDFTGCHPEIAEALKQGLSVRCKVWDDFTDEAETVFVCYYSTKIFEEPRYGCERTEGKRGWYRHAEPIKTKRVLRPVKETIPLLLENGFIFNDDNQLTKYKGELYVVTPKWLSDNAGKEVSNTVLDGYHYLFMEIEE